MAHTIHDIGVASQIGSYSDAIEAKPNLRWLMTSGTPGLTLNGDGLPNVKPYVKRQKNDASDAEAICEAVGRPNMRFVPIKTSEQQSCLTLHRTRHLFIRQQTSVINAIRTHLAEFGIVAPVGRNGVEELLKTVADPTDKRVSELARACLLAFGAQLQRLKEQILEFDRMIRVWHRSSETSRRLEDCPGVGPVLATAIVATVAKAPASRAS
jgi:transposase